MSWFIRFNKPYDVLPQFTDRANAESQRSTLSDFIDLPGVYPAGRLDRDSEGLMLLTDSGRTQAQISDPKHKMAKTYWVQVEGLPDAEALKALRDGVELRDGLTRPAKARMIDKPAGLWPRTPPIRVRQTVPDNWIELILREGRNSKPSGAQNDSSRRTSDPAPDSRPNRELVAEGAGARSVGKAADAPHDPGTSTQAGSTPSRVTGH